MAKPVKVKKDSAEAAPAKKGGKKAAAKAAKEEPKGGLRGRVAKAQAAKAKPAKGGKERKGTGQFLREVRVELSKVTWPSREELIQSTLVVLVAVAISGAFIAVLDLIFSRLINVIS